MSVRKIALALVVGAVAVVVWTRVPPVPNQDVGVLADAVLPSSAGCPVVTGREAQTELSIASVTGGVVGVSGAAGGSVLDSTELSVADNGGAELDVVEFLGASSVGILADLPAPGGAAATITSSASVLSAALCTPPIVSESAVVGLSSASGEVLDLVLANPYANDAVVEVRTSSEAGLDSASELSSVIVPARSVVTIDLGSLLPLRARLAARIVPDRGVVHAVGVQASTFERMTIEAVAPASEWFVPIPDTGAPTSLVIAAVGPTGADFTVDAFGDTGSSEAVTAGTIGADEHVELDTAEIAPGARFLRVEADGLVVASVVVTSDVIRAGTPGAPAISSSWLVPGVAVEGAVLRIVNPSGFDADVEVIPLSGDGPTTSVIVAAGATGLVPVSGPGSGFEVRADTEIAVAWSVASDAGFALGVGAPMDRTGGE